MYNISKRDSFNIKVHIVYKILALLLAIISLLDQQKTLLLSLHLEEGVTVFMSIVCMLFNDSVVLEGFESPQTII